MLWIVKSRSISVYLSGTRRCPSDKRRTGGTRHEVTRRARRQRLEVGAACRRHLVQGCEKA